MKKTFPYLHSLVIIVLAWSQMAHATISVNPTTSLFPNHVLPQHNKLPQKPVFRSLISLGTKALVLGAIAYGLYYLVTTSAQQPTTVSNPTGPEPKNPKIKNFEHVIQDPPANFSHTGPICYRNSLFQVLCHADGVAPAILQELQNSPRNTKVSQQLYNLMMSQEKVKDWNKYPELHAKLFKDVENESPKREAQDPVHLFSSWALSADNAMAVTQEPFKFKTDLSMATEDQTTTMLLVNKDLAPDDGSKKFLSAPEILCLHADAATTGIKPPKKHTISLKEKNIEYKLVGIVCHIKSQNHYIAYIRQNHNWYRCDDIGNIELVNNPFNASGIWTHQGHNFTETPHMLFYAKFEPPANFSHTGPICYRNSLFQVLCHADGVAPAILQELQNSPRKTKASQQLYNLMMSQKKVKDWNKYPELHQMLFTAVGETGDNHKAQDAMTILSYLRFGRPNNINNRMNPNANELSNLLLKSFTYTRTRKSDEKKQQLSTISIQSTNTPSSAEEIKTIEITHSFNSSPSCLYVKCDLTTKPSKVITLATGQAYQLVGIVCHMNPKFAHYIAYIRRNHNWYRCDDIGNIELVINPFNTDGIWTHQGHRFTETPHMLFYAKLPSKH